MKKFLRSLDKNRGFYFATLFVGIIFSGLSVLGPTISGTMISAFLEDASRGMHYLILYLVIGVLQIVFCLWDSYMGKLFKIRQKQLMRDVSFRSFARKDYASREEISSFEQENWVTSSSILLCRNSLIAPYEFTMESCSL